LYNRLIFLALSAATSDHITTVWADSAELEKKNECVNYTVALPFTLKSILRQKEELWKFKYFTMQKYDLPKNPAKNTIILQDIIIL
jgi:hypothetical protein